MSTICRLNARCAAAALAALLSAMPARAGDLIDVQFGQNDYSAGLVPTTAYQGAAVVGAPGDRWNLVTAPYFSAGNGADNIPLFEAGGAATGVSLSYYTPNSAIHWFTPFTGGAYDALMSSYLFADNGNNGGATTGPAVVSFSGLLPNTGYQLLVYSVADTVGRGTRFTSGDGRVSTVVRSDGSSTFEQGANYGVMSIRSTPFGQISLIVTNAEGATPTMFPEGDLNGIQLVGPLTSPVPEPGAGALLAGGLGLLALAARRRGGRA
jgi:hypothetical protein